MATEARMVPLDRQRRRFRSVLRLTGLAYGACAVLLQPFLLDVDIRVAVSAVAGVLSAAFLAVSAWLRARQTGGRRRRFWRLAMLSVAVATVGNG